MKTSSRFPRKGKANTARVVLADKSTFLREAKEKYKKQLENNFVSEMNFIYDDSLILRVWFDVNFNPNNELGETGFMHRWCTVENFNNKVERRLELEGE